MPVKSSLELGVSNKSSKSQNSDGKKSRLSSGDGLNKTVTPVRVSSYVKQREYRRADGRKRIIPEAAGVHIQQENISGSAQALDFPFASSDPRKNDNSVVHADSSLRETTIRGNVGRSFD
ncbi:hypothetical protein F3Y22_tig00110634pilonHSYRG00051 [Hibiscus syriacus]|uniref:Uncharacterized protein n=1 Tax=Hibiscus syriacus TaxID=106335 RepID=A0A6A3A1H5_HIBSY|nr:hypothetical protein F3Y22_tig00110634pilonHSYRG00051 [Hibiscus syriacus]